MFAELTSHAPTRGNAASTAAIAVLAILSVASPSAASDWIEFDHQTSTRLVADSSVGAGDVAEKDYAWGDVDHDGDIDLVCVRKQPFTNGGKRRNVLFLNEGGVLVDRTADFATEANDGGQGFLDLTADRDVELVDVDGDGWLDIVTGTTLSQGFPKTISHPRVYMNQASVGGVWQGFFYDEPRFPTLPIAPNFCGLASGDVTGDGAPDLYFTDYNSNLEDRLLINDGSGVFVDESTTRMTDAMRSSGFGTSAVIRDMNGDGFNDIVKGENGTVEQINNAGGGFFDILESVGSGAPYFFNVGDLNNDGRLDIVTSDDGIDKFLLNQGNGPNGMADFSQFQLPGDTGGFGGNSLVIDLDNDGWNDVITTDVDVDLAGCGRVSDIHHNMGGPAGGLVTFQHDPGNIPSNMLNGLHDVAVFDLNGDGLLDMVFGRCNGTFVWVNNLIVVNFEFPLGVPAQLVPNTVNTFPVNIEAFQGDTVPGSAKQHVSIDGDAFVESNLTEVGPNSFMAALPAASCPTFVRFYFTTMTTNGVTHFDPPEGADAPYEAIVAFGSTVTLNERFENSAPGWTVDSVNLDAGEWVRVDPVGTTQSGAAAQPEHDAGEGDDRICFITQQSFGGPASNNDVDGGPTILTSPVIDLQDSDALISYARWHFSALGTPDTLKTQITSNGAFWVDVDETFGTSSSWETHVFRVGAFVVPTANVRVRFSVADIDPSDSVTESGIDNFVVEEFQCDDTVGPEIVHGRLGVSFAETAFGGYIDPRRESTNGVDLDSGIDRITIGFTEPVVDLGGIKLTAGAFTLIETGDATPPAITDVELVDDRTARLTLDRMITLQEWLTVSASVQDLFGNPISNLGDLGPAVDEPDRVDIGFLPADIDQSGLVNPLDLLRFKQLVNNIVAPESGTTVDFIDVNRSGGVNPLDLLTFKQLINGVPPSTQPWSGTSMNNARP